MLPPRRLLGLLVITILFVVDNSVARDYSIRATNAGKVKGVVERYKHQNIEKFLGIPYASAPVGKLRFEPPVPPESWGDSIRDAIEIPPACPQPTEGVAYIEYHVPGFNRTSEDCLFLNVYLPKMIHHKSMPVLVFVHGGSYQNGMGAMFDGSAIAAHGVVVVTFNYRLGPLGFLNAADDIIHGNYGMLDMIRVLQWIQENIVYFRGDPSRVTIDGHSAGGCSVGLLMMSPLAKGLFHQVIQQSGSALAHWSVATKETKPNFFYKSFVSTANCYRNTTEEIKQCMQSLDSETLEVIVLNEFEWSTSLVPQYRPVVDGHFLPQSPEELVKSGHVNVDKVLTGATMDEGLIAALPLIKLFGVAQSGVRKLISIMSCFRGDLPDITGIIDSVIDQYVEWSSGNFQDEHIERAFSQIVGDYFITAPTHLLAEMLAQINVTVYLYNYEYKSLLDQWDGVIHGAELFYLSGCPFTGHKNFRYDQTDRDMASALILLWTNFIKYGTPALGPGENANMPVFKTDRKLYTRLNANEAGLDLSIASDLRPDKMSFWNKKVPSMYNRQMRDLSDCETETTSYVTISTGTNVWILISVCICLSVLTVVLTVGYYRLRQRVVKLLRQLSVSASGRML